ncbi:MAG TPA: hypothetical protein VHO24_05375 [Opitutaceae bacterium]|nr:hypothetical protein [Opitutaceae bacterium]
MTESELRIILKHVEAALDVYRKHEGKLSALEISMKSMLTVIRTQAADQLVRENTPGRR